MKNLILLIAIFPFNSSAYCFSEESIVKKSSVNEYDWISVEKHLIEASYTFIFTVERAKDDREIDYISLMFVDDMWENASLISTISYRVIGEKVESGLIIHESHMHNAWLTVAYEGCNNYYNFKFNEM